MLADEINEYLRVMLPMSWNKKRDASRLGIHDALQMTSASDFVTLWHVYLLLALLWCTHASEKHVKSPLSIAVTPFGLISISKCSSSSNTKVLLNHRQLLKCKFPPSALGFFWYMTPPKWTKERYTYSTDCCERYIWPSPACERSIKRKVSKSNLTGSVSRPLGQHRNAS